MGERRYIAMSNSPKLAGLMRRQIDGQYRQQLFPEGGLEVDFSQPEGVPALVAPDSVSWRVFKNPLTLFIGGVAAVILELGEARVRAGVWDHTSFKTDPVSRLRRTGLAAMVTVYGPGPVAEKMIAGVTRAHQNVSGIADDGRPYQALEVELMDWVQATASFGFVEAYHQFCEPLSLAEHDAFYAEAAPAARLYGAYNSPHSLAAWDETLAERLPQLSRSPILHEFLAIMRKAPALPGLARPMLQPLLVKAALSLVPEAARGQLGLTQVARLTGIERGLLVMLCRRADRLYLPSSPAAQSCLRMGLPGDWLYRQPRN